MPTPPAPHLPASVETCHWGAFDAALPPVMTVASGQRFTVATVSGGAAVLPPSGFHVPPELLDIHARSPMLAPGHILTGPVAVADAMPGDALEVRVLDVQLRQDWGYNVIRPLAGTLPDEFDRYRHLNIPLDAKRMLAKLPWGLELPLHETALLGTFELVLHRGWRLEYPRAETPTHWITMGMDPDLDAYTLCSLAADFRITQTVNGHRGVHGMLRKSLM